MEYNDETIDAVSSFIKGHLEHYKETELSLAEYHSILNKDLLEFILEYDGMADELEKLHTNNYEEDGEQQ